jgi:putative transcriptional regulator
MSRHPAPEEMLLDYAAGTLPEGPALAVALHAALDPEARRTVEWLLALGSALLESEAAAPAADAELERALVRLDRETVEAAPATYLPRPGFEWAPRPLARYLAPEARWERAFGGFERMRLGLADNGAQRVELLRLPPGRGLPRHRHDGSEYTVVLQGGYTDNTGSYGVGDFAVGPGEQGHEPIADHGEPCIALIVLERPIVLSGRWGRLLNPLVRRGWI